MGRNLMGGESWAIAKSEEILDREINEERKIR